MNNSTHDFNRKSSKSFSESDFVSEDCEMKFTEVFVSGFERTVTKEYLQQWFTKLCFGVKSVEIHKDYYGRSSGSCTVCFYNLLDAKNAVRVTNNREMNGRILRVKLCTDVEDQSEALDKCVFVKGFGETLDDMKLEMYFKKHVGGDVKVEVAKFEDGAPKGYGKVQFCNCHDAKEAVLKLNGMEIHGNTLTVEPFKPKEQRSQEPNRNIYVKGFGDSLDDNALRTLFEQIGEIDRAKVEKDVNGTPKGFGYVCFKRHQDAETAIRKMNGEKLGSKILTVKIHQTKEERQKDLKNRNLHILNLHESVSEDELKELFAPYGKIISVHIDASPRRGINQGYVCFETSSEADTSVAALHLRLYKGLKLKISPTLTKNEFVDSTLKLPPFRNGTSEIKARKKEYTYKSQSMGNLKKNNTNLQALAKFDEGDKTLGCTKSDVPSLMKTSTHISTNSDRAQKPGKLIGGQELFLNKIRRNIAANFQIYESPQNEIHSAKSDVPSHIAGTFSENKDKRQTKTANKANLLEMPMAVPDLFQETRTGLFHSALRSEEHNADSAASQNASISNNTNTQGPTTVIPKAKMNNREQRAATKVSIRGGIVIRR